MKRCRLMLTVTLCLVAAVVSGQDAKQPKKQAAKKKARPNPAMAKVEDVPGLPRVLLIGDSISIGYTAPVREMLKGVANVHRPLTNCGPTTRGVAGIDEWLGDGKWDVIHFNFGLHDLKYMGPNGQNLVSPDKGKQQVPVDEYEKNLRKIVGRLKQTGAVLIWRNTTPVPPGAQGRVVGHSKQYNEVAAKVMAENGIHIHDMYSFVMPRMDEIMLKANVHFTPDGSRELAKTVVAEIKTALKSK
ncbi:MAG: SGNH/GDSL hydrolase family protein [Planctomycetales bacterium]|nr:SGNH/GDSL hydrolase family protein [Planctomycetales bacterium]